MKNKDSVELIEYTKAQDAFNCATHALGAVLGDSIAEYFPQRPRPPVGKNNGNHIDGGLRIIPTFATAQHRVNRVAHERTFFIQMPPWRGVIATCRHLALSYP